MGVIAKFRCLNLTENWEHRHTVDLGPVVPQAGLGSPENEENRRFWKASPSGKATLNFDPGAPVPFEPGAYYYVRFIEAGADKPGWVLEEITQSGYRMAVEFRRDFGAGAPIPGLNYASLSMGIDNRDAWPAFAGKHATCWAIVFERAP